jgi:hypothetical protein
MSPTVIDSREPNRHAQECVSYIERSRAEGAQCDPRGLSALCLKPALFRSTSKESMDVLSSTPAASIGLHQLAQFGVPITRLGQAQFRDGPKLVSRSLPRPGSGRPWVHINRPLNGFLAHPPVGLLAIAKRGTQRGTESRGPHKSEKQQDITVTGWCLPVAPEPANLVCLKRFKRS